MGNKVSNMNEDIELTIIDLGDLLHTKSHKEILEFLKDKQLHLGKPIFLEKLKHKLLVLHLRAYDGNSTNHSSAAENLKLWCY